MRIDQLLNKLCLVKTRSIAKKACDNKLVFINDSEAKASQSVKQGDLLEYQIYGFKTVINIIKIPTGNVSKKNSTDYYEVVSREKMEIDL